MKRILSVIFIFMLLSCNQNSSSKDEKPTEFTKGTFGYDVNFLKQYHKDLILLSESSTGAQVVILPAYQGRVMTSTAEGNPGASFGWINHELIASGKFSQHFSAFGGEERMWLGPEGGQYSIYFKKGAAFTFDNWNVPPAFDTEPFDVISATEQEAKFVKEAHLENFTGSSFDIRINRNIRLLNKNALHEMVGDIPEDISTVGFVSENILTNAGETSWTKEGGLLSIWILSMLNADQQTTIALPYKEGDSASLGKIVTDDYFGKVPSDRLKVEKGLILLKADGNHRSKVGISPKRAKPFAGSYDAKNNVLTISQFTLHERVDEYVNSQWQMQDHPYAGDAVNAYNDGPINGKQMGKFYEIESSSPAAALKPGECIRHEHRTIHLKGSEASLNEMSKKVFGVELNQLQIQ